MRSRARPTSPVRVAQAAPPDPPAAGDDLPPGDGPVAPPSPAEPAPPSAEPAATPAPGEAPAPTPATGATPDVGGAAPSRLAEHVARPPRFAVTGSMIERATPTTPAPLTILHREDLDASGRATLADILQQLPAQANAIDPRASNGGDGWARVDLRGLGSNRTLTLINGRRVVAGGTGAGGSVDLGTIPLAAIDRVEILKAGASAIHGSDAIGGVVNIITRSDFEGVEASLYTAASQHDLGVMYDAGVIAGHRSENKKGQILVAGSFQRQDPELAGDRLFSRYGLDFGFEAARPGPGRFVSPSRGRIDAFHIDTNGDGKPDKVNLCGVDVQYCTLDGNGAYRPYDAFEDQAFQQVDYLRTPSSSVSAYSTGRYQLRSEVAGFFEVSYLHRASDHVAPREPFSTLSSGISISKASVYNPTGGDVLGYDRTLEDFGPSRTQQRIGTLRTTAGFQGTFPDDAPVLQGGAWEISWGYGRSQGTNTGTDLSVSRLASALGPSFVNAAGVPSCGTPAAPIAGCVPMNLLGLPGSIDPDALDHVLFGARSTGFTEQQTVLATTHGRIARFGRGDLSVAAGADVRKEAAGLTPTGDSLGELPGPAAAGTRVVEGFGELSLVPLRGQHLEERVELDLAARGFHADSSGNGLTWNAGGLFRPITSVAVRATYAASFRAPSPGELFQVPHLAPETAKVLTAGFVFEPSWIQGLSLTADYWNIDLTNAIHPISTSTILSNCYTAGLEEYCNLIHRDPAGGTKIDFIDDPRSDLGDTSTSGLDIAAAYDHTLGGASRLHEQLEAQVLFAYDVHGGQTTHNRGAYDFGVGPALKASWSSAWQHPSGVSAGLNVRYVGSFTPCGPSGCSSGLEPVEAGAWYKVDLFGSYLFKNAAGATTLAAGVNNLLDRNPSLVYLGRGAVPVPGGATREVDMSDAATYDYVGRLFYLRLSHRF